MSLTFKLLSLVVRTAAKPIGNYIKRQAQEHDGFRRFAIAQAQRVHRIDMRMRLGLLHDAEAQQRMHEREQRAAEEKKRKEESPTVRTEKDQKKYEEQKAKEEQDGGKKKEEKKPAKVKIRPLSDARAIELGANFFSESFIFAVAVGLLLLENFRSKRSASAKRDEVAERIDALEAQVVALRKEHKLPELEALNERIKRAREAKSKTSWYNPAGWFARTEPSMPEDESDDALAETSKKRIPGSVPGPSPQEAIKPTTPSQPPKPPSLPENKGEMPAPREQIDAVKAATKHR